MTRILRVLVLVVVRLIAGLSESRIIADFGDWKMLTAGAVSACLSESQISRITLTKKSVTSGQYLRQKELNK